MKKITILLCIFTVIYTSCKTEKKNVDLKKTTKNEDTIKTLPSFVKVNNDSIKIFEYINDYNNDYGNEVFGYQEFEGDEDNGVKGIALDNDYVFLTDPIKKNIKRISLQDGNAIISDTLSVKHSFYLRDLVVFNNMIYVFTDFGLVFILDKELNIVDQLDIGFTQKKVFSISDEKLTLYLVFENGKQNEETNMIPAKFIEINKNNNFRVIERKCTFNELYEFNKTGGKSYKLYSIEGSYYIENDIGKFKLNNEIKRLISYDAVNLDFNENELVYFNNSKEKLTLYYQKLK